LRFSYGRSATNASIEAFYRRCRQECLNTSWYLSMDDARDRTNASEAGYNETRPHSSLGYLSPSDFASQLNANRKVAESPDQKRRELSPMMLQQSTWTTQEGLLTKAARK